MFLKQIELSGFKSFADKTVIRFENGLTGIVGPNGCGKSNVSDCIRWVLGEQSAKSLRSGSAMSDIVFAGSESRKPVNMARASLTFDNSQRIFDCDYDEVEITRELVRSSGESRFYLNKTLCRLRDIQDLVTGTGLGRGSLSIITQGSVSSFADARPEERRLLFEEAAGVARYRKRKKDSLSRLESTKNNLDKVEDQIASLQQQKESLEQQAKAAKEYLKTRDELADLEISVLVHQIEQARNTEQKAASRLEQIELEVDTDQKKLEDAASQLEANTMQASTLDGKISDLQTRHASLLKTSYELSRKKVELDEKRKYTLMQGNTDQKRQELYAMQAEAQKTLAHAVNDAEEKNRACHELELQKNQNSRAIENCDRQIRQMQSSISELASRRAVLETRLHNSQPSSRGASAVLQNASHLPGIEGQVRALLKPMEGYELAVDQALGGAAENIVTTDEKAAKNAIEFLKRSKNGRATFLPLTVCRPRFFSQSQMDVMSRMPGYLGTAADFIQTQKRYDALSHRLLGTTAVCDHLDHAVEISRRMHQSVKLVTLEGDIVHAGGAMTGGSLRNPLVMIKQDLEKANADFDRAHERLGELVAFEKKLEAKQIDFQQKILDAARVLEQASLKKTQAQSDLDMINAELASLPKTSGEQDQQADTTLIDQIHTVSEQLEACEKALEELQAKKKALNENRLPLMQSQNDLRRALSSLSSEKSLQEVAKAKAETALDQYLMRLGEVYSLTFEAALEQKKEIEDMETAQAQVSRLRRALARMGEVNLMAPAQYEQTAERWDFLSSQKNELTKAMDQLLEAIREMDQSMSSQFKEGFEAINAQLDGVFKSMFGGGRARLVLTDPDNMLETGVDIDVQPPGKAVKSIQTFSGGEKALIAISVLFAILKARTMPLCIFDEAEAALDQANVERFASWLARYKDDSQFIVITHRPGTMEQCDMLYGITMQKDGVSRVLHVQLSEAVESAGKEDA